MPLGKTTAFATPIKKTKQNLKLRIEKKILTVVWTAIHQDLYYSGNLKTESVWFWNGCNKGGFQVVQFPDPIPKLV